MVLAARATKLVNYNEAIKGQADVQRLGKCCNVAMGERFHRYCEIVSGTSSLSVDYHKFRTDVKRFENRLCQSSFYHNNKNGERAAFSEHFSLSKWLSMSLSDRAKHEPCNCLQCKSEISTVFGLGSNGSNPALCSVLKDQLVCSKSTPKAGAATLESVLTCFSEAGFQSHFKASVADCLAQTKYGVDIDSLNKDVELTTAMSLQPTVDEDVVHLLKHNLSFSQYGAQRSDAALVSPEKSSAASIQSVAKDHVGAVSSYVFDREKFVTIMNSKMPGDDVNWSALARECQLTNSSQSEVGNGGEVMLKYAKQLGYDTDSFNPSKRVSGRDIPSRVRRCKRRLQYGCPYPIRHPLADVKNRIKELKAEGVLEAGEEIASFSLQSDHVTGHDTIETSTLDVPARKVPLERLVQRELQRQIKIGVLTFLTDDQHNALSEQEVREKLEDLGESSDSLTELEARQLFCKLNHTVHLKFWHDHGEIAGHSNIVFNVTVLYDRAIHSPNSQALVEKPSVYILGRSKSNVAEQVKFSSYRAEDLPKLDAIFLEQLGISVHCVPRFCVGDTPARAFECGTQMGGNFPCPCGLPSEKFSQLGESLLAGHRSLNKIKETVVKGVLWKSDPVSPFQNLLKKDVERELIARSLHPCLTAYYTVNKADLDAVLTQELTGIQRLPAILLAAGDCRLQNMNCEMYEVPNMEFMHDMCNIVEHVMCELPYLESSPELASFIQTLRGDQRKLRAVDARRFIVKLCVFMQSLFDKGVVSRETLRLVQVIVEIIEIGYSHSSNRSVKSVLRFHNLSFLFGMYLRLAVCNAPKSMSNRKMFGIYYHNLTCHAPMIYRVVSIRSLLAELDESTIWQLRQISSATSSGRPMEISENCLMRATFLNENKTLKINNDHIVGHEGRLVRRAGSSFIPRSWMDSQGWESAAVQSHLKRIADYLLPGPGVWYDHSERGILFYDQASSPSCETPKVNKHGRHIVSSRCLLYRAGVKYVFVFVFVFKYANICICIWKPTRWNICISICIWLAYLGVFEKYFPNTLFFFTF